MAAHAPLPPPPKKKIPVKYFSGNYHVKQNSGILLKMSCRPKVDSSYAYEMFTAVSVLTVSKHKYLSHQLPLL